MWKEYSVEGYYDIRWLTVLWSTQDTVEVIVLKAARRLGSNSSVVNDPLGEPGLPSAWGSVYGDHMFSSCFLGEFLNWGL